MLSLRMTLAVAAIYFVKHFFDAPLIVILGLPFAAMASTVCMAVRILKNPLLTKPLTTIFIRTATIYPRKDRPD